MPSSEKITHEKIINAVLSSAFVKGNGATSLVDIADKLGIKKASLYNHYESKDAMIADTLKYCSEYLRKTTFIPSDMPTIAQKYSADIILKGIANRWFKINEKEPLLYIYSFIESEKYFSSAAYDIAEEIRTKLTEQTVYVLTCMADSGKIKHTDPAEIQLLASLFVSIIRELTDKYITQKKQTIRSNPETGTGSLFDTAIDSEQPHTESDKLIDHFCTVLK